MHANVSLNIPAYQSIHNTTLPRSPSQTALPSWQELRINKLIRPKQAYDHVNKKDLTAWTKKDGPYSISCISALEEYQKMQLCTNQIRIFTYLQSMGCLQQAFESGYASEVKKLLLQGSSPPNLSPFNTSGSTFSFLGRNQSGGNDKRENIFNANRQGLNIQPMSKLQQTPGISYSNPQNIFGSNTQSYSPNTLFGTPQNLTFNSLQNSAPQNNIFLSNQQSQQSIFNQGHISTQSYTPSTIPITPEMIYAIDSTIVNQISQSFLSQYPNQIVNVLLNRIGVTADILDFLFCSGFSLEEIQDWIIRRVLLKQLEDHRYRRIKQMINSGMYGRSCPDVGHYPEYSDQFSRYVELVLAKKQWFSWQQQVLRQEMRKIIEETPFHQERQKDAFLRSLLVDIQSLQQNKCFVESDLDAFDLWTQGNKAQPFRNKLPESRQLNYLQRSSYDLKDNGFCTIPIRHKKISFH